MRGTVEFTESNGTTIMQAQSDGEVSIGGSHTAWAKLHVDGGSDVDASALGGGYFMIGNALGTHIVMDNNEIIAKSDGFTGSTLYLNSGSGDVIVANGGGDVGIGTSSPTNKLSVNGGANNLNGVWGFFSDARIKDVHADFDDGLDVILQLRPVTFTYNDLAPLHSDELQIGVLAQELEQVAPYMVDTTAHGAISDLREVNPQAYTYLLINAIKALHAENEALRSANSALSGQVEANTEMLAALKMLIDAQASR